jgi:hypothetical protein
MQAEPTIPQLLTEVLPEPKYTIPDNGGESVKPKRKYVVSVIDDSKTCQSCSC